MKAQIKNAIHLFPNIHRAFEVSIVSGLKIKPFCAPDYPVKQALADLKCTGAMLRISDTGEIFCELSRPQFSELLRENISFDPTETWERLEPLAEKQRPTVFHSPSASQLLLKTAWERVNLSIHDYNIIMQIAQAVAILDGSDKIKTEHLAEGIHYRALLADDGQDLDAYAIPLGF